ncbi:MAG TPA: glutamate-1-semialdehyde-2,1-aminomutase [Myxococcales bacterium]|nr:glutamate-1-semialdehyde-2,1-aminomutase [Deltaproteobacteria bacterium]HAA56330.1 glutamate-1-semialdehyde-2,1-aminomutase [Myxococcales bacterium]
MSLTLSNSREWMERAQDWMPGGVNSPVRAYKAVGGTPPWIKRGKGAYIWDEDENQYIDYVGSWGPMIVGHAHPEVVEAIQQTAALGTSYGAPTSNEVRIAQKINEFFPSIEMVRLVNSGTEATMSAIRLARAATKRDKIIKFSGCYHGHADSFLIAAGSGAMTFGVPSSPGVTSGTAADTLLAEYNDLEGVKELFAQNASQIAAVIIEPIPGNMGLIAPADGFLQGLRTLTEQEGALLIFDEVMTGFRVAPGGAQELCGVEPDLTTLGKVIGGGLPVGAYGGKRKWMELIAPSGPVYQAGTLSGNPLAVAAGMKTLELLQRDGFYEGLEAQCQKLEEGLRGNLKELDLPLQINRFGSMICLFFSEQPVVDFATAKQTDTKAFATYFQLMLEQGIFLPASQFEALFVSASHSDEDIARTVEANKKALAQVFQK